jgi:hypothetical protein
MGDACGWINMDTINALPSTASPLYFSEYLESYDKTHTHTRTHTNTEPMLDHPCTPPQFAPFFITHSRTLFIIPLQYDKSNLLCIFHLNDTENESGNTSETIIAAYS